MTAEEDVKNIEPTAYAGTWKRKFFIAIPRPSGGPKRLSGLHDVEADAWADARDRLSGDVRTPPDAVIRNGAVATPDTEAVRAAYPAAHIDTWRRPDGKLFFHVVVPQTEGPRLNLSKMNETETQAWASAAARVHRESGRRGAAPAPPVRPPAEQPTLRLVTEYIAAPDSRGVRGSSYGIDGHRAHVFYALPFVFPMSGKDGWLREAPDDETSEPVHVIARMVPTFACPVCRLSSHMVTGDLAALVLAESANWSWSFIDDAAARNSHPAGDADLDIAMTSLAVAVGKAIAHMREVHGFFADWHTVDVCESFPGTAYGAVVLRGLGTHTAAAAKICDGCGSPAVTTLGPFNVCGGCYSAVAARVRGDELQAVLNDTTNDVREGMNAERIGRGLDSVTSGDARLGDCRTCGASAADCRSVTVVPYACCSGCLHWKDMQGDEEKR